MIRDLHEVDSDPFRDQIVDVCICGAGVAGITLALHLSSRLNVLLLEAGGEEYSSESQSVYQGKIVGRDYFDLTATRLRFFGGSSNHWAGWCRTLDSSDFQSKPYVEYSGWPINKTELDPYFNRARTILDIRSGPGQENSWHAEAGVIGETEDFENIEFSWSRPPTRFGKKYREEIDTLPNVTCYLNANVVDIKLSDNHSAVERVEVRDYRERTFFVRTRCLVLAAGGIENPRILLNCNSQVENGLGNEKGLVGSFFTEHPHHKSGEFILENAAKRKLAENWKNPFDAFQYYSPSESLMASEKILNAGLRLQPFELTPNDFEERLKRIICRSETAQGIADAFLDAKIACLYGRRVEGKLHIASEQALNSESRVKLDFDKDRFGKQKIVLDWRLSEIDKRTVRVSTFRFGQMFAQLQLGRVRVSDWLLTGDNDINFPGPGEDEVGGNHHMCTTRMASSPHLGIVDPNQRVFGIRNLYVAGSSVFSTGGHANPTLTIVQMTLRLADYLNKRVFSLKAGTETVKKVGLDT
jgi:choline dehydrogenase-like flavoprotein